MEKLGVSRLAFDLLSRLSRRSKLRARFTARRSLMLDARQDRRISIRTKRFSRCDFRVAFPLFISVIGDRSMGTRRDETSTGKYRCDVHSSVWKYQLSII